MKQILQFVAFAALSAISYAQNTFPTPSGNVGIGTSTPTVLLDVKSSASGDVEIARFSNPNIGVGNYGYVNIGGTDAAGSGLFLGFQKTGTGTGVGTFGVRGSGAALSIDQLGNLGIGTATPTAKLHVGGSNNDIRFDYNGSNNYYGSLRWAGLQLGNNGGNRIVAGRTTVGGFLDFYVNNTNDAADYTVTPNGILAARIDPAGNVGIGTSIPGAKLEVSGPACGYPLSTGSNQPYASLRITNVQTNGVLDIGVNSGSGAWLQYTHRGDLSQSYPLLLNPNGGNVGIGTTSPTQKLSVNGTVRAKEVIVDTGWSDYVFDESYQLSALSEVERHIKAERHLPGIPSAKEVAEQGISLGEMQARLLAKIEELTLHVIAQEKLLTEQSKQLSAQSARIERLEADNTRLATAR